MPDETDSLAFDLLSHPARIGPARRAIEAFAVDRGFDAARAGEIGLVVNEALANIIRHAYAGAEDRSITLRAWMSGPDALEISLRDWGSGKVPDLARCRHPEDGIVPGGVGLECLKRLTSELRFIPQPDGMLLKMTCRKR